MVRRGCRFPNVGRRLTVRPVEWVRDTSQTQRGRRSVRAVVAVGDALGPGSVVVVTLGVAQAVLFSAPRRSCRGREVVTVHRRQHETGARPVARRPEGRPPPLPRFTVPGSTPGKRHVTMTSVMTRSNPFSAGTGCPVIGMGWPAGVAPWVGAGRSVREGRVEPSEWGARARCQSSATRGKSCCPLPAKYSMMSACAVPSGPMTKVAPVSGAGGSRSIG